MKRRSAIALIVVVVLVLAAALALRWAMRPQVLGPQVLSMAGRTLGLEISAREFDYRLRGTPQVVAHDVSARVPGVDAPLVEAERVFLSLPWATLRSRGADLTIERIELDAPRLELEPFMAWWSQRPPGDGRLPTLERGLRVERGEVDAGDWSLRDITVDLPDFAPDARLRGGVSATWVAQAFEVPFAVRVAMARPAIGSGVGIAGTAAPQAEGWRLRNRFVLSTRLDAAAGGGRGVSLRHVRLSSASRHESADSTRAFALGLAADGGFADGALVLASAALAVRGQGLVPDLDGRGRMTLGPALAFELAGDIRQWPSTWPALPPPIGESAAPLPFQLAYSGPPDLSGPLQLELARSQARFEGSLRVPDLVAWVGALDSGTPLPPLQGRLDVPRMDVGGASLHGVEVTFDGVAGDERSGR